MMNSTIEEVLIEKEKMEKSIKSAILNFIGKYPNLTPAIEIEISSYSVNDGDVIRSIDIQTKIEL